MNESFVIVFCLFVYFSAIRLHKRTIFYIHMNKWQRFFTERPNKLCIISHNIWKFVGVEKVFFSWGDLRGVTPELMAVSAPEDEALQLAEVGGVGQAEEDLGHGHLQEDPLVEIHPR